jgi:hypothetical protein
MPYTIQPSTCGRGFKVCPSLPVSGGNVDQDNIFDVIADEVTKPARRTYPRRAVISHYPDEIWSVDLADLQAFEKDNDGYKYALNVVDVFSRYAWAVPLKTKGAKEVLQAFKNIVADNNDVTPAKLWSDQGSEFLNKDMRSYCKAHDITMYSTFGDSKSVIVERFNRTLKTRLSKEFIAKNSHRWIDMIEGQVQDYNDSEHRTIGMTPRKAHTLDTDGIASLYAKQYGELQHTNAKPAKFQVDDYVRLNRLKGRFEKGYDANWTMEIFQITEVIDTVPWTYRIKDLKGEVLQGTFYEPELQKTQQTVDSPFMVEKVLKRRVQNGQKQVLVKFLGYSDKFNQWLPDTNPEAPEPKPKTSKK